MSDMPMTDAAIAQDRGPRKTENLEALVRRLERDIASLSRMHKQICDIAVERAAAIDDLLEALEGAVWALERGVNTRRCSPAVLRNLNAARAAIRKARGEG